MVLKRKTGKIEASQLWAMPLSLTLQMTSLGTTSLGHGLSLATHPPTYPTLYPLHLAGHILYLNRRPSEQIQKGKRARL